MSMEPVRRNGRGSLRVVHTTVINDDCHPIPIPGHPDSRPNFRATRRVWCCFTGLASSVVGWRGVAMASQQGFLTRSPLRVQDVGDLGFVDLGVPSSKRPAPEMTGHKILVRSFVRNANSALDLGRLRFQNSSRWSR